MKVAEKKTERNGCAKNTGMTSTSQTVQVNPVDRLT